MFNGELVVTTIFKTINLCVLIGVISYFFKTRVWFWLQESIAHKKEAEVALLKELDLVVERTKQLERETEEQRQLCAKVKNNVLVWRQAIDVRVREQKEKIEERAALIKARAALQSASITQHKLLQAVAQPAVRDARALLEKKADAAYGKNYLQKIVGYLKESA